MIRRGSLAIAAAWAVAGPAPAPAAEPAYPFDLPPELASTDELLPDGRAVCVQLGLDPSIPGRCNATATLDASSQQTDRTLWFFKASNAVYYCPGKLAFTRHVKTGDLTWLCRQTSDDVTISAAGLSALDATAARLNAIQNKTLQQHQAALDMKQDLIELGVEMPSSPPP